MKKEEAWLMHHGMIWAMGGGGGGGMIWANRSLVGQPPMLSLSLSWKSFKGKIESEMNLRLREFILQSN